MRPLNDHADLAEKIRRDPIRFVRDFMGEELVGKQAEVLESLRDHRETLVRSAHDVGKTWLAARATLWFLFSHPNDSIVITTAPVWAQVEGQLWKELASAYAKSRVTLGGRLLMTRLDLGPKWFAIGLATDPGTAVNLQGYHASHVLTVLDEADGIAAPIWNALDSVRTSAGSKLLAIGNPLDPTSEFKKRTDAATGDVKTIKISADDVLELTDTGRYPFLLQRSWVDEKRERWGEGSALYQGKILAQWPDQGSDTLIPLSWLERAKGRAVPKGLRAFAVDVARFGAARTVRTMLEGNWLAFSRATSKEDTMETVNRVVRDIESYAPVEIGVDDTGVGGGVTDRLRELGHYATPFNFGGKAWDASHFVNRGSEIYWLARSAFEHNLIGFAMSDPDAIEELIAELSQVTYDQKESGKIRVSKYGRREHLSEEEQATKSPDRADSFVIALALVRPSLSPVTERPAGIPLDPIDAILQKEIAWATRSDQEKWALMEATDGAEDWDRGYEEWQS